MCIEKTRLGELMVLTGEENIINKCIFHLRNLNYLLLNLKIIWERYGIRDKYHNLIVIPLYI